MPSHPNSRASALALISSLSINGLKTGIGSLLIDHSFSGRVDRRPLELPFKIGVAVITVRDDCHARQPLDSKGRVVPPDPSRALGRIEFRHLVKDFGVVRQSLQPVGE